MGDISTQQKLQLARQVRERYQQDRQDLGQREQLLYGRTLSYFEEEPVYGERPGYGGQYGGMEKTAPWDCGYCWRPYWYVCWPWLTAGGIRCLV